MRQTTQFQQTPEILKQWKQKKEKPVCIIAVNMNEGRDFSPVFDDHTHIHVRYFVERASSSRTHCATETAKLQTERVEIKEAYRERERESVPDACTLCVESESSTCICIERE